MGKRGGVNDNQSTFLRLLVCPAKPLTSLFSLQIYIFIEQLQIYIIPYTYIYVCTDIFIEVRTSWRVRRNKHHTAIILINYQWSDNMLFATDLTNERTLYLITRLTPRAHPPRWTHLGSFLLRRNISLLLLSIFSFLTLSFFFPPLLSHALPRRNFTSFFL